MFIGGLDPSGADYLTIPASQDFAPLRMANPQWRAGPAAMTPRSLHPLPTSIFAKGVGSTLCHKYLEEYLALARVLDVAKGLHDGARLLHRALWPSAVRAFLHQQRQCGAEVGLTGLVGGGGEGCDDTGSGEGSPQPVHSKPTLPPWPAMAYNDEAGLADDEGTMDEERAIHRGHVTLNQYVFNALLVPAESKLVTIEGEPNSFEALLARAQERVPMLTPFLAALDAQPRLWPLMAERARTWFDWRLMARMNPTAALFDRRPDPTSRFRPNIQ